MTYMEWKEIALRIEEGKRRAAKKWPWWKLLYLKMFDECQYRRAVLERLHPDLMGDPK